MTTKPTLLFRLTWRLGNLLMICSLPLLIDFVLHPFDAEPFFGSSLARAVSLVAGVVTAVIGYAVVRKAPGNTVGSLLIIFAAAQFFGTVRNTTEPGVFLVFQTVGVVVFWGTYPVLMAYFPTGKTYFHVTQWMSYGWLLLFLGLGCSYALGTPQFMYFALGSDVQVAAANPLYIASAATVLKVMTALFAVYASVYLASVFASQVFRYLKGNRDERRQLQWFLFGIALFLAPQTLVSFIPNPPTWLREINRIYGIVSPSFLIPVSVGYAILRHKLYDIDIIIRRTLIYAVLTTILAIVYFGGIIVTQQVFKAATGQTSDLAIVVSTLLIAALFSPIRRRVQDEIDRRLYRRKYDVEKTLAAFQQNLRDEVDMETLQANLIGVVNSTMQPNKIALWVKQKPIQKIQETRNAESHIL